MVPSETKTDGVLRKTSKTLPSVNAVPSTLKTKPSAIFLMVGFLATRVTSPKVWVEAFKVTFPILVFLESVIA